MSIIPKLLKSRQRFPKPLANWDFGDASKIQEGATAVDVAGWTDSQVTNQRASGNLVTGGTFDSQLDFNADWGPLNGGGTWDASGAGRVLSTGSSIFLRQEINAPIGSFFQVDFDVVFTSGIGRVIIGINSTDILTMSATGHISRMMQNLGTDTTILIARDSACDFTIDNLEVIELDPNTVAYDLAQSTAASQPVFSTDHIVFDGTDHLEDMPTQSGDFTYVIKFEASALGSTRVLLGSNSNITQLFYIDSNSRISLRTSLGSISVLMAGTLVVSQQYTIALTRAGSLFTLFIDGVEQLNVTDAGDFLVDWLCGRSSLSSHFDGKLYDTLIYPSALTATEVVLKTASLA